MLLAVNMIVRNEAARLADALESVRDLADEVVVHDTGSDDGTVGIARRAGARVVEGAWHHDFARARDVALAETRAAWVLQLDADERWAGDPEALRRVLAGAAARQAFTLPVVNVGGGYAGGFTERQLRLFPRAGTRWRGRLHECPVRDRPWELRAVPAEVAMLRHLGYADEAVMATKGERNAELARLALQDLLADGCQDPDRLAPVLLDLGRSLLAADRRQEAVEALETVRGLVAGGPEWAQATDYLARVLLAAGGHDEVVLALAEQLREAGVDPRYCHWLAAPALGHLGRPAEGLGLLGDVDQLVDPAGREHDLGAVVELRAMLASLAGRPREAVDHVVEGMAAHGRVAGRGDLLLGAWDGTADELADVLAARLAPGRRAEVVEELERWPGLGGRTARALRRRGRAA